MARQLQFRRGTTQENLEFIGALGEITVDTEEKELRLHDGETPGGEVIGSSGLDLFDYKWSDHLLDDPSWLRVDTFEWNDGDNRYSRVYTHLLNDIEGKPLLSEVVAGIAIQYYLADDGHKICPADQESVVLNIYNTTGIAWYYIIDTQNIQFKLPRTKHNFTGIRNTVGGYVAPGVPNITGGIITTNNGYISEATANQYIYGAFNYTYRAGSTGDMHGGEGGGGQATGMPATFDASRSSSIYGNSTTVQPPATQMYLYCYVGKFKHISDDNNPNYWRTELNTTNCITKIPQDIDLELNNRVLTLKAGSKVYVPNGYSGSLIPNATNWGIATLSFDNGGYWNSIIYDGTKFIAFGNKYNSSLGHSYIITSTSVDGISWSSLTMSFQYNNTYGNWKIACNGTNYIALSSTGYISTSTNGTTWMVPNQDTNLGNNSWSPIIYDGTKYVALSSTGYISTSTDGTTWTVATQNTNLGNNSWISLIYDGTKYVALDENGYISTSTDGTTWGIPILLSNLSINSSYWRGVASGGSKFVALSSYQYTAISYPTPDQLIFDELIIPNDLVLSVGGSGWTNTQHMIVVSYDGTNSYGYRIPDDTYSGPAAPTITTEYGVWYDTLNNIVKITTDYGTTWSSTRCSLPICIATDTGGYCDKIDQIFNGFGYIGSTAFALPGVKGLVPNERNKDGSLKNTEFTIPEVWTRTSNSLNTYLQIVLACDATPNLQLAVGYVYDEEKNLIYWSDGVSYPRILVGHCYSDSSYKISNFFGKTAFHAVDYNDKEFIAHQSMPGDKYIDLTLGASSTQYTAPADGYYMLRWWSTGDSFVYFGVDKDTTGLLSSLISNLRIDNSSGYGKPIEMYISVSKGQIVPVVYTGLEPTSDTSHPDYKVFRFVYANGSE